MPSNWVEKNMPKRLTRKWLKRKPMPLPPHILQPINTPTKFTAKRKKGEKNGTK
jgi:hypothetical protein